MHNLSCQCKCWLPIFLNPAPWLSMFRPSREQHGPDQCPLRVVVRSLPVVSPNHKGDRHIPDLAMIFHAAYLYAGLMPSSARGIYCLSDTSGIEHLVVSAEVIGVTESLHLHGALFSFFRCYDHLADSLFAQVILTVNLILWLQDVL